MSDNYIGKLIRSPVMITIILTFVTAIVVAFDKGAYIIVNTTVTGGMWALMAIGLALVFGVMNIVNFAHGEFFMIGGFISYSVFSLFSEHIATNPNSLLAAVAPLISMFAATIGGGLVGIICEFLVFRPLRKRSRGEWVMNSFIITVGVSVFIINFYQVVLGTNFRGIINYWSYPALSFFDVYISFDRVFVFVLAVLVMIGFWVFMQYSTLGGAISAVSQDETGSLMVGININVIQTLTMALSCAFAALAGACLLFMFPVYPTVGLGPLYNSWFIIILVGLGQVGGAVLGSFVIALIQIVTTVYVGEGWGYIIPSMVVVVILLIKPSGILGSEVRGIHEQ